LKAIWTTNSSEMQKRLEVLNAIKWSFLFFLKCGAQTHIISCNMFSAPYIDGFATAILDNINLPKKGITNFLSQNTSSDEVFFLKE